MTSPQPTPPPNEPSAPNGLGGRAVHPEGVGRLDVAGSALAITTIAWPWLLLAAGAPGRELVTSTAAVAVGLVVALLVDRMAGWPRTFGTRGSGWLAATAGAACAAVTPAGLSTVILAALIGGGVGLAAGPAGVLRRSRSGTAAGLTVGLIVAVLLRSLVSPDPVVLWFVVVAVAVPVVVALLGSHRGAGRTLGDGAPAPTRRRVVAGVVVASAIGVLAWTGANDPQLSWFGPVVSHGPRGEDRVALTFDDGPNVPYSSRIADVLESRGARGTFFLVGKAIDAEPAAARDLLERGHLVANHSYHHDYWRWLDPGYPELDRTQDAFERHLGVCPALYRPPHGQRTPFVSAQVAAQGMRTITWDVSGMDWSLTDGAEVARRILARVQPGSIVLLHDGLDGVVDADRQVVLDALPIILDGLEERGLRPVRVDELVDTEPYLTAC